MGASNILVGFHKASWDGPSNKQPQCICLRALKIGMESSYREALENEKTKKEEEEEQSLELSSPSTLPPSS